MSRRAAIGVGGGVLAAAAVGGVTLSPERAAAQTVTDRLMPEIRPRDAWGADLPVTGEIIAEDDVRFLLVHHTASTNDYSPDEVVDQIRRFHSFHTGPEKGWPDVAYNFFVDRYGVIWEARAGSIAGPVRGDATGGSQGFAILCSLIGDHSQAPVTEEAKGSLIALLAWLAERHGIDTAPSATVDFVSRGSNRWPAGTAVTAATISGHRDMSQTTCPGDLAYGLLAEEIPQQVSLRRTEAAATPIPPTTAATAPSAGIPASTTASSATVPSAGSEAASGETGTGPDPDQDWRAPILAAGGTALALGLAAMVRLRTRRARA